MHDQRRRHQSSGITLAIATYSQLYTSQQANENNKNSGLLRSADRARQFTVRLTHARPNPQDRTLNPKPTLNPIPQVLKPRDTKPRASSAPAAALRAQPACIQPKARNFALLRLLANLGLNTAGGHVLGLRVWYSRRGF